MQQQYVGQNGRSLDPVSDNTPINTVPPGLNPSDEDTARQEDWAKLLRHSRGMSNEAWIRRKSLIESGVPEDEILEAEQLEQSKQLDPSVPLYPGAFPGPPPRGTEAPTSRGPFVDDATDTYPGGKIKIPIDPYTGLPQGMGKTREDLTKWLKENGTGDFLVNDEEYWKDKSLLEVIWRATGALLPDIGEAGWELLKLAQPVQGVLKNKQGKRRPFRILPNIRDLHAFMMAVHSEFWLKVFIPTARLKMAGINVGRTLSQAVESSSHMKEILPYILGEGHQPGMTPFGGYRAKNPMNDTEAANFLKKELPHLNAALEGITSFYAKNWDFTDGGLKKYIATQPFDFLSDLGMIFSVPAQVLGMAKYSDEMVALRHAMKGNEKGLPKLLKEVEDGGMGYRGRSRKGRERSEAALREKYLQDLIKAPPDSLHTVYKPLTQPTSGDYRPKKGYDGKIYFGEAGKPTVTGPSGKTRPVVPGQKGPTPRRREWDYENREYASYDPETKADNFTGKNYVVQNGQLYVPAYYARYGKGSAYTPARSARKGYRERPRKGRYTKTYQGRTYKNVPVFPTVTYDINGKPHHRVIRDWADKVYAPHYFLKNLDPLNRIPFEKLWSVASKMVTSADAAWRRFVVGPIVLTLTNVPAKAGAAAVDSAGWERFGKPSRAQAGQWGGEVHHEGGPHPKGIVMDSELSQQNVVGDTPLPKGLLQQLGDGMRERRQGAQKEYGAKLQEIETIAAGKGKGEIYFDPEPVLEIVKENLRPLGILIDEDELARITQYYHNPIGPDGLAKAYENVLIFEQSFPETGTEHIRKAIIEMVSKGHQLTLHPNKGTFHEIDRYRGIVSDTYNAIKDDPTSTKFMRDISDGVASSITRTIHKYGKDNGIDVRNMMSIYSDYKVFKDAERQISQALHLGKDFAHTDQTMAALATAFGQGPNNRATLDALKAFDRFSGSGILQVITGQAFAPWSPTGGRTWFYSGALAGSLVAGAAVTGTMWPLAIIPFMSPRVMGRFCIAIGCTRDAARTLVGMRFPKALGKSFNAYLDQLTKTGVVNVAARVAGASDDYQKGQEPLAEGQPYTTIDGETYEKDDLMRLYGDSLYEVPSFDPSDDPGSIRKDQLDETHKATIRRIYEFFAREQESMPRPQGNQTLFEGSGFSHIFPGTPAAYDESQFVPNSEYLNFDTEDLEVTKKISEVRKKASEKEVRK